MFDICLFAGTTEGRLLAEHLADTPLQTLVSVATEYGQTLLKANDALNVRQGRMDQAAMEALFGREKFSLVIDATHPHAAAVSENIRQAARSAGIPLLRLLRQSVAASGDVTYVASIEEAAQALQNTQGNILAATGSKALAPYRAVAGFQERLFVRVLPTQEALESCAAAGIPNKNIIALQGPFTQKMNEAMMESLNIRYLVTKDSGTAGGMEEKLAAARQCGVHTVVIGRPEEEGLPLEAVISAVHSRFSIPFKRRVHLISMGLGQPDTLTVSAQKALAACKCCIGASRLVNAVPDTYQKTVAIAPQDIVNAIQSAGSDPVAVLLSGDAGFYSGARKLLPLLNDCSVTVHPGISSLQALCAKKQTAWDDCHVLSLHGRSHNLAQAVQLHPKVFALVGGANGAADAVKQLADAGLDHVAVTVGENLGGNSERITTGSPQTLCRQSFAPLSVLLIENPDARPLSLPFLKDEDFVRQVSEPLIPMTKEEVRAVALAKLRPQPDAVIYDVGAGTGSVAVALARCAPLGQTFAIEARADACGLIRQNAARHGCFHLNVVEGLAPEALCGLPAPTHAFIGGSKGNLRDIIAALLQKNPHVRLCMPFIALESQAEALKCVREFQFDDVDIVHLSVSKAHRTGLYHLMKAQNPILLITCQNKKGA